MNDRDDRATPDDGGQDDGLACLRCGASVVSMGTTELRTGGMTGAAHVLLGNWADLGEGKLPVEILACESCGHLELRSAG